MSLATARVRESARTAIPRLRLLVTPPRVRRRPKFITTCVGVLVGCLLVLLLLNIGLARGAYHEKQLTEQQTALMESEQALSEQVARQGAPSALAEKARELGMIENPTPAFIKLSDGTVLGEPTPARAPADDYTPASLTRRSPQTGSVVPPGVDQPAPGTPDAGPGPDATSGDGARPVGGDAPAQDTGATPAAPAPDATTGQDTTGQDATSQDTAGDGAVPVGAGR